MKKSIRTIIQLVSLVALAALCIYLFPRYTNPFKYHFEVGQPWGYGLVTAEYDFPIYKPESQLQEEYAQAMKDYTPCYTLDPHAVPTELYIVSIEEMERIIQSQCSRISIVNNRVSTPIDINQLYTPKTAYYFYKS